MILTHLILFKFFTGASASDAIVFNPAWARGSNVVISTGARTA